MWGWAIRLSALRRPAQDFAIGERHAGQVTKEGAVADHRDARLRSRHEPAAKAVDASDEDLLWLDGMAERILLSAIVPPRIVEMIEDEVREVASELGLGAADIATALQAFAMQG